MKTTRLPIIVDGKIDVLPVVQASSLDIFLVEIEP